MTLPHGDSKRLSALINDALYKLKCGYEVKSYPSSEPDRVRIQWGRGAASQMVEVDGQAFGLWLVRQKPGMNQVTAMLQRKADSLELR